MKCIFYHFRRKGSDDRDINIRVSLKSLALITWFAFLAILIYELLWVTALLLLEDIRRRGGGGGGGGKKKKSCPLLPSHNQTPQAQHIRQFITMIWSSNNRSNNGSRRHQLEEGEYHLCL